MGFGSDFYALDDLDPALTFLTGDTLEQKALIQSLARRLMMPRGGNPWAPGDGLDLRGFLSETYSPSEVQLMIAAEMRADERVSDCAAVISVNDDASWSVSITCTASTGAVFAFTISVTAVTVALLEGK